MTRQEWLSWRHDGIGASDVPVIMSGRTRHKTILQLYEEKISPVKEDSSYITDMGHEYETRVRGLLELMRGESFTPDLVMLGGFEFMKASLDGRSEDKKRICEIKLLGKDDWANAKSGIVPKDHWVQVQAQLLVSQAEVCVYAAYLYERGVKKEAPLDPEKLAVVLVRPDKEYHGQVLAECSRFWLENICGRRPPIANDGEEKDLRCGKLAEELRALEGERDSLDEKIDAIKTKILEKAEKSGSQRCVVGPYKLMKVSRAGNVEYKIIPELQGVDLEKYRKPGSLYWKWSK